MTPSEIADLFGEIIYVDDIAIDDNFFDVGGNSILALGLIATLRERSGVVLQLIDVVDAPTPEGLARVLAQRVACAEPGLDLAS